MGVEDSVVTAIIAAYAADTSLADSVQDYLGTSDGIQWKEEASDSYHAMRVLIRGLINSGRLLPSLLTDVEANIASATSIPNATTDATARVRNWAELKDVNNEFDPTTGLFTANGDGNRIIAYNVESASVAWPVGAVWTSFISRDGNYSETDSWLGDKFRAQVATTTGAPSGRTLPIYLTDGQTIEIRVYQSQGAAVSTNTGSSQKRRTYLHIKGIP